MDIDYTHEYDREHHRTRVSETPPADGLPFYLTVALLPDGAIQHRSDIRFSTYLSAVEGARALVTMGAVYVAFIHEERAAVRRA